MLLRRIESLLNGQAAASPRARELLAALAGQSLRLEITHSPWRLLLASDGQALALTRDAASPASATVRGTPVNLARLAGTDPQAVIRSGAVQIDGDAEIAGRFQELGALLHPDLEEALSHLVGDVAAHQVGDAARAAVGWFKRGLATGADNLAEYLAHERRDLIPRAEAAGYLHDVDALRERVDRLAARIAALDAAGGRP